MASPYEALDLTPDATVADVRAAFRRVALANHPDKLPPGTPADAVAACAARLDAAVLAARLLSDPLRRAAFDARAVQLEVRSDGRVSDTVAFADFTLAGDAAAAGAADAAEYEYECRCGGAYVVVGRPASTVHAECDTCSLVIAVTP